MEEVCESLEIIKEMYDDAMDVLKSGDAEKAKKIIRQKEKILELDSVMRKAHLKRVNEGTCKASLTKPFTKILNSIDRMGSCCMNLADVALDNMTFSYFTGISAKQQ